MDIAKVWLSSLIVLVVAILAVIYARNSQADLIQRQSSVAASFQLTSQSQSVFRLKSVTN